MPPSRPQAGQLPLGSSQGVLCLRQGCGGSWALYHAPVPAQSTAMRTPFGSGHELSRLETPHPGWPIRQSLPPQAEIAHGCSAARGPHPHCEVCLGSTCDLSSAYHHVETHQDSTPFLERGDAFIASSAFLWPGHGYLVFIQVISHCARFLSSLGHSLGISAFKFGSPVASEALRAAQILICVLLRFGSTRPMSGHHSSCPDPPGPGVWTLWSILPRRSPSRRPLSIQRILVAAPWYRPTNGTRTLCSTPQRPPHSHSGGGRAGDPSAPRTFESVFDSRPAAHSQSKHGVRPSRGRKCQCPLQLASKLLGALRLSRPSVPHSAARYRPLVRDSALFARRVDSRPDAHRLRRGTSVAAV